MASLEAILIAGFMHLIFRFALFIDPLKSLNTPGPRIPTIIVCAALTDLIFDSRIVPLCLSRMPNGIKILCECVVAMFLIEVGMLIVWQALEFSIYLMIHTVALNFTSEEFYAKHETLLIGIVTFPVAIGLLLMTSKVTHHLHYLYRRYLAPKTNVSLQMENAVEFLERSAQYKRKIVNEALSKYNTPEWKSYLEGTAKGRKLFL
ncbi:hypothetical protein KR044_009238 [Drosophila immigrans]|nr:hypothetical protein KR044_009238 [Drosophila immigrans]